MKQKRPHGQVRLSPRLKESVAEIHLHDRRARVTEMRRDLLLGEAGGFLLDPAQSDRGFRSKPITESGRI
jgi:hypothetical protein